MGLWGKHTCLLLMVVTVSGSSLQVATDVKCAAACGQPPAARGTGALVLYSI